MTEKTLRRKSDLAVQAEDILRKKVPRPNDDGILELTKGLKKEGSI